MMESNQMMEPIDKMPGAGGQEDLGLVGFAQLSILCLPAFYCPKYTVTRSTFNTNKSRFDFNMFQVVVAYIRVMGHHIVHVFWLE